jgi:integrase
VGTGIPHQRARLRHRWLIELRTLAKQAGNGLRHTHASQLIASGVDIVTISKRLGHKKPSVTLAIYTHMFHSDDSKAAAAINAALGE